MRKRVKEFIESNYIDSAPVNLDHFNHSNLMEFWFITNRLGWDMARYLFPERPKGYVSATRDLGHYAANKAAMMSCWNEGNITGSDCYEQICKNIWDRLPKYARW